MTIEIAHCHKHLIEAVIKDATAELLSVGEFPIRCEIAFGSDNIVIGADIDDDDDKDVFVSVVNAMTIRHRADATTLVAESWAGSEGWCGRPSEDPNREEVLIIVIEDHHGQSKTLMKMQRDGFGDFANLELVASNYRVGAPTDTGRFSGLLAPLDVQDDLTARLAAETFLRVHVGAALVRGAA
jgi:hypothetical protein